MLSKPVTPTYTDALTHIIDQRLLAHGRCNSLLRDMHANAAWYLLIFKQLRAISVTFAPVATAAPSASSASHSALQHQVALIVDELSSPSLLLELYIFRDEIEQYKAQHNLSADAVPPNSQISRAHSSRTLPQWPHV